MGTQLRSKLFSCSFCAMLFALFGCGELKKLDEMKDTTVKMAGTTGSMNEITKDMKVGTCELYDALRQGDTLSSRRVAINGILDARETARKISEAGKYYMAFEFQLWSEQCQDIENLKKEILIDSAVREYLREVQEFFPNQDLEPNPAAQSNGDRYSEENLQASLNALAAALHMKNPKQELREKKNPNFRGLNMLDILQESLAAKASIDSGKKNLAELPSYVKEVLLQEKFAVAVLQSRYNIATAIVLDSISDIRGGFFKQAKMFLLPWDAKLDQLNKAQILEFQDYVKGALEVRDFLRANSYNPQIDSNLRKVLKNLRFNPSGSRSKEMTAEQVKLVNMLKQYAEER